MRGGGLFAICAGLVAASCAQEGAPPASAPEPTSIAARYRFEDGVIAAGVYRPQQAIQRQNWVLVEMRVDDSARFTAWPSSPRGAADAPMLLVFADTDPLENTAQGVPRTLSIVPASYDISSQGVVIHAISAGLGAITFEGRAESDGVLSGTLKLGPERFDPVVFKK